MKKLVVSLLLTLASTHSIASTTDVTLTGTLTPSACLPKLENGGMVDYGELSAQELHDMNYELPAKQLGLSIQCASETAFALTTTDNRNDSSGTARYMHGLGMHKGQNIGSLAIGLHTTWIDDTPAGILLSTDGGESWLQNSFQLFAPSQKRPLERVGFSRNSGPTPTPGTSLRGTLQIFTSINRHLSFNETIQIDGSTTFNIVYL